MERGPAGGPIRFRVKYRTVRELISEYTASVAKSGCTIKSPKALAAGTSFIFELCLEGLETKHIEVEGKVIRSAARPDGAFDVGIEYSSVSTPRRVAMTRFLDQVFSEHLANRKHARVPVNLVAEDAADGSRYLVRDLSRGGMGLRLAKGKRLPAGLAPGTEVFVTIVHDGDVPFELSATVARLEEGDEQHQPSIGLCFDSLAEANARLLDALLYLHRPQLIQVRFPGR